MPIFRREWGEGRTVLALHPLGLDSSAFAGFGPALARRGLRTVALDLPGFGRTPAPAGPLRPAVMAEPVVALARDLPEPPALVGISMGGRVALEAALVAPESFRSVIAIAPYLPWTRFRGLLQLARAMSPAAAERVPLERVAPVLRALAEVGRHMPFLRDDDLSRAGARLVYDLACPATRASLVSAARELALDPAFGPGGFWSRLAGLRIPAAFVWGERDRLVSARFAERVARTRPGTPQLLFPCLAHALNREHHRCLAETVAWLLEGPLGPARAHESREWPVRVPCLAHSASAEEDGPAAHADARA